MFNLLDIALFFSHLGYIAKGYVPEKYLQFAEVGK